MKKLSILSIFIFFYTALQAQTKTWRSDKKNEIELHFYRMWSNYSYSCGVGYERTIYKPLRRYNSYFSSQTSFLVNTNDFLGNFTRFSSASNHIQSFIKYNLGYQKIFSIGLGTVIVGERFYLNPTALVAYKYDISKIKTTISLHFQLSQYGRTPPAKSSRPYLPTSIIGPTQYPFSIFRHWSGGVSIGRYF